jgi:hypothetical protein
MDVLGVVCTSIEKITIKTVSTYLKFHIANSNLICKGDAN